METRANYIAVGFFTLVTLVVMLALVYWFGRYGDDTNLVPVDVRIQGSVSGLGSGSAVQFNGITVGRVKGLSLDSADPRSVIVHTMLNASTPLRSDSQASIGIRGLSGGAFVQLEGGSPGASELIGSNQVGVGAVPVITGQPAALSDLVNRVNQIAGRTESVMGTLEEFVSRNQATATRTLENAEVFTKALADNSEGVGRFLSSAGDVANSLQNLSEKLDGSVSQAEAILKAVDPEVLRNTVSNVDAFAQSLADQRTQIAALVTTVNETANQLSGFSQDLNATLKKVDGVVSVIEPARIQSIVESLDATTQKTRAMLDGVEAGKVSALVDDVAATAKSTREISAAIDPSAVRSLVDELNKASQQLSSVASAVDPQALERIVSSVDRSSTKAEKLLAAVDETKVGTIVDDVAATAQSARGIVEAIDQDTLRQLVGDLSTASKSVTSLVAAVDANKVNEAVDNVAKAAEGSRAVISDLKTVSGTIAGRNQDIDQIVTDAAELAARLNETSKKLDGVLDQASGFFGSGVTDGLVDDARATLAEFRNAARTLTTQVGQATGSISRFTDRGLAGTQGLIRDARRSLNRIDRVIRGIESNPSSLLSGSSGSGIRESSGGRPRR